METKNIELNKLEQNDGQITGLPKNPRVISNEKLKELQESISSFPDMLSLRELIVFPNGKKFVVIAGNMRLEAAKGLGYKELPCKILDKNVGVEFLKQLTIKDNISYGDFSWSDLDAGWDKLDLINWGIDECNFAFTPNIEPTKENKQVTESQVEKQEQKLEKQFDSKEENFVEVICPDCGSEFKIKA